MASEIKHWKLPGWPWELEVFTLLTFLIALLTPLLIGHPPDDSLSRAAQTTATGAGRESLQTQFSVLGGALVVALYILHITIAAMEAKRITSSPVYLVSPITFSLIAFFRISGEPGLAESSLAFINGSWVQAVLLVLLTGGIASVLCWWRRVRFMQQFNNLKWGFEGKAAYDMTFFRLLLQWRPLMYAPRRYLAGPNGIVIEGYFYAMPIPFSLMQNMWRLSGSGMLTVGQYFAGSVNSLVRIQLRDSLKALYLSPQNRDGFLRYCQPFIAVRQASGKASATRHGNLTAHDAHLHAAHHEHEARTGSSTNNPQEKRTRSGTTRHTP